MAGGGARHLRDNLYDLQRRITGAVLHARAASRRARRAVALAPLGAVDALKRVVVDLRTGAPPDFATLSVALQAVRRLVQD